MSETATRRARPVVGTTRPWCEARDSHPSAGRNGALHRAHRLLNLSCERGFVMYYGYGAGGLIVLILLILLLTGRL